jgi:hypothetical protein
MQLKLIREIYSAQSTIGKLYVNGTFFCFTLEDYCRDSNKDGDLQDPGETKVFGKTCIPQGEYKVILNQSTRFKKLLPLLLNVPGFSGIRIHNGNIAAHTEGCILVGSTRSENFVGNSIDTLARLMIRLKAMVSSGQSINISILSLKK